MALDGSPEGFAPVEANAEHLPKAFEQMVDALESTKESLSPKDRATVEKFAANVPTWIDAVRSAFHGFEQYAKQNKGEPMSIDTYFSQNAYTVLERYRIPSLTVYQNDPQTNRDGIKARSGIRIDLAPGLDPEEEAVYFSEQKQRVEQSATEVAPLSKPGLEAVLTAIGGMQKGEELNDFLNRSMHRTQPDADRAFARSYTARDQVMPAGVTLPVQGVPGLEIALRTKDPAAEPGTSDSFEYMFLQIHTDQDRSSGRELFRSITRG